MTLQTHTHDTTKTRCRHAMSDNHGTLLVFHLSPEMFHSQRHSKTRPSWVPSPIPVISSLYLCIQVRHGVLLRLKQARKHRTLSTRLSGSRSKVLSMTEAIVFFSLSLPLSLSLPSPSLPCTHSLYNPPRILHLPGPVSIPIQLQSAPGYPRKTADDKGADRVTK